ncbi:MAG: peptidylprolyl isomerase [Deltaproteobacteria bacterium]|nr:peptidylprolyl isomerase [Deltaproteobacteria bacterium]MBW2502938.1 peptidylprolyl isomerase [Deltaproteobacteria bacterium]MBW2520378.1 peptidylprolyl isomerase [Deltaproteobacteria bacterium]
MSMYRALLFGFCLFVLIGCESHQQEAVPPLLLVNGEQLSREEFLESFKRTLHPEQQLSQVEHEELQRSFLVQLIDRMLMHAEARRLRVFVSPAEVDAAMTSYRLDYPDDETVLHEMLEERGLSMQEWQAELRESLILEALLDKAVYPKVTISEDEISEYYETHREEFDRPAQVRARQIVVADEAEGQRLLGLLRQGEGFASLAQQYSLSPEASEGGDLGFFSPGKMPPEFDAVVFDLPVGKISDLVKSEYGYHLFLVEEKRTAARLDRQEAAEKIRHQLLLKKRETAYHDWLQGLRSEAQITVDWDQLSHLQESPKAY